jgi:lipoprotein-anchoring transpeptidase ErfK/SrfK
LRKHANYGLIQYPDRNFARHEMIRAFAFLVVALMLLADAGAASAQSSNDDFFNFFGQRGSNYNRSAPSYGSQPYGRGSDYYGGGSGPIPREMVNSPGRFAPGTIYIDTAERRLYLILGNGEALRYGIGVGRDGFGWAGTHRITAKKEWPGWTPPAEMRARRPDLPAYLPGGIENPLGARAMYLGSTLYRIHGSNEPETIGHAVSSGCIRMTNEDVTDLYNRVSVGTVVVVR